MAKISLELIKELAELARLEVSPAEAGELRSELGSILDYVEKIQTLDTTKVIPASDRPDEQAPLRDDVPDRLMSPDGLLPAASLERGLLKTKPALTRDNG